MIEWQYYPKSDYPSDTLIKVINVFKEKEGKINSNEHKLSSNKVLSEVRKGLQNLGFEVEKGKKKVDMIYVPVLFGKNGIKEKSFNADGYHPNEKIVIEIEAGRAVTNYQFLKDLFQACMMKDIIYLIIAVRRLYNKKHDFQTVTNFFDTLYVSRRLDLPLKGILIIGY